MSTFALPPSPPLAQTLVAQLASAWRAGDAEVCAMLTAHICATTGLEPQSLLRLTDLWARTHTLDALKRFGQASPPGWQPVGTVAIVAPGNMPVATWQLLVWAWLTGNRVRLRPSQGDPHSAANLWAAVQLLAARNGLMLDRAAWLTEVPGDHSSDAVASALLHGADALVVMGGDLAVATWTERARKLGFTGPIRGHDARHSAALLGPQTDLAAVAPLLAHDALLADGRGCLSLRTVLAVGLPQKTLHDALVVAIDAERQRFAQGAVAPQWLAERQLQADTLALRASLGAPLWVRQWPDALLVTAPHGQAGLRVGWGARALLVLVSQNWTEAAQWLASEPRLTALAVAGLDTQGQALVQGLGRSVALTQPGLLQAPDVARWPDGAHPHAALVQPPNTLE